ncbi:MAG: 4-hydroxy-tetrahydrodipicolinate reductase [Planctomycetes bacterium]|nr:4-hydroxy-tetrahydrodipicolinate reductase [Planctomycetota bacterium]
MALKIALNGAGGRMGRRIADLAAHAGHDVVAPIDHKFIGEPYGSVISDHRFRSEVSGSYNGGADVLIDFSLPEGFRARLADCLKHGTPFVSGTTGLTAEDFTGMDEAAETIPIVWAPNMSVGVNLLFALAKQAASALPETYDIEIVEMHHRRKIDAPSGTALGILRAVCAGNGRNPSDVVRHGREGQTGERTRKEIGMHALRGGDVVGDHTVIFATEGERIELTHKASSRDTFAGGALRAAEWLVGKQPGLYGMPEVLGING